MWPFKSKIRDIDGFFKMHTVTEMEHYRADTFWSKEPETIAWLQSSKGRVFWDIGANIGVYSLYRAAIDPDTPVFAFEPVRANYVRLCQNIDLNGFKNVHPFNIAMSNATGFEDLFIRDVEIAASGAQIKRPVDEYGEVYNFQAVHRVPSATIDKLISYGLMTPEYVKIDVDGAEGKILAGMSKPVESLLIELNMAGMSDLSLPVGIRDCDIKMRLLGMKPDNKFNHMKPHSSDRRGGNPVNRVYKNGV